MIKLWYRLLRKIAHLYFNYKYKPIKRRDFDLEKLLAEISREKTQNLFATPLALISFDDISLMDGCCGSRDYGGKYPSKIHDLFGEFIEQHNFVRPTLYFVPNPIFIGDDLCGKSLSFAPFNIVNNSEHKLIGYLQELEKKELIEIAAHGYNHFNDVTWNYYSAFEFEFMSDIDITKKLELGCKSLENFFDVCGFKPPAWGCGQLLGKYQLLNALSKTNYSYVSLSTPDNGLNYARQMVSHIYPAEIAGLANMPQNISMLWPLAEIKKVIDLIADKKGIANVQLHFTAAHSGLRDGISLEIFTKLSEIVRYMYNCGFKFMLTKDAVKLWLNQK